MPGTTSLSNCSNLAETEPASRSRQVQPIGLRNPDDLESAYGAITRERPGALITAQDPLTNSNRQEIVEFLRRSRLPSIHGVRAFVDAGALMAYGPSLVDLRRRPAVYVDKILRGAKPGDLPVEQPTKFELTINLKTAKALGLEIPPTLLARADEVIE